MAPNIHIPNLPEEIIHKIITDVLQDSFDHYPRSICNLRLTCQLFNRISAPLLDYRWANIKHSPLPFLARLLHYLFLKPDARKNIKQLCIRSRWDDKTDPEISIDDQNRIMRSSLLSPEILTILSVTLE